MGRYYLYELNNLTHLVTHKVSGLERVRHLAYLKAHKRRVVVERLTSLSTEVLLKEARSSHTSTIVDTHTLQNVGI